MYLLNLLLPPISSVSLWRKCFQLLCFSLHYEFFTAYEFLGRKKKFSINTSRMNRHLQNLVLGGNQQSLEPTIKSMAKVLGQTQRNVVSHVGIFYSSTLLSSRYLRPLCRFKRGFTQYFLSEQFDNSA